MKTSAKQWPRSHPWVTWLIITLCAAGCKRAPDETTSDQAAAMAFERVGDLLIASTADQRLIRVTHSDENIRAQRFDSGQIARIMSFQARAEQQAYGVYALGSAKSDMVLPLPLAGEPIAWPDLDYKQALARLLQMEGLPKAQAHAAIEAQADPWFAEGLRLFCILRREAAVELFSAVAIPPGRTLLIVFELE